MKYILILSMLISLLQAQKASVRQLFSVQTVLVQKHYQYRKISAFGYIKADQSNIYEVTPRFGGYIEKLFVDKIYQKVTKGELLATVYSPTVLQAKDNYLNALTYAKPLKNSYMIQNAKERLKLLNISDKEILQITKKRKVTPYVNIYAPASGVIFVKKVNKGAAFHDKEMLFKIINLKDLWIEAKIDQKELRFLKNIVEVDFKTSGYNQTFKASKVQLYPNVSQKSARLTLRLQVNNSKHKLFPGMYVSLDMRSASKEYLTLPTTAVILKNGKHYVFIPSEYAGEYDPKVVKVEVLDPHTYIIKKGLKEGQKVVNNALFLMDSDAQINGLY